MAVAQNIDEYVGTFDESTKALLESVRRTIHEAVPEATEAISYAIPTFQLNGKNLIHFAAFKTHIGLYATPDGHEEFEPELSKYRRGKGSVQFPLNDPMPFDLISRIARFRAEQITKGEK